jgi:hypothetical protein
MTLYAIMTWLLLLLLLLLLLQGITTAIAYQHGMGSSAFALAVALSSIVMYDAAGVRRHAGGDNHDMGLFKSPRSSPFSRPAAVACGGNLVSLSEYNWRSRSSCVMYGVMLHVATASA